MVNERLFVAVPVASGVAAELDTALEPLRARAPSLRWIPRERWHITLAFIGSTSRRTQAREAVEAVVRHARPVQLALTGQLGRFGARVLWAGLEAGDALPVLAVAVQRALSAAGFGLEERPFRPHLTVARARRGQRVDERLTRDWSGPRRSWNPHEVQLMRSQPGPHYERLAAWQIAPEHAAGDA